MTPNTDIRQEIRHYLLGDLSEEARRRVEERLLTEENFLEELTLAEEELLDDYVAGRLAAAERPGFEQHFLSTEERRRQLRFARALGRYASAHAGRRPRPARGDSLRAFWGGLNWAVRAGFALGAVAVIAGALWLARPAGPPTPRTFAAITLTAGAGDRAEGALAAKVRLPLGADALKMTLTLPEGAPPATKYRAEMLNNKGGTEPLEVVGRDERTVAVVVPGARLARGQYAVRLHAVGADGAERRVGGSYLFDVE